MAATKRKEKKPVKTGASGRYIKNLQQSILDFMFSSGFDTQHNATKL
jgi:hypothetical protein